MAQQHVAASGRHGAQESAGFNAVGHHLVLQPCKCSTPWMRIRLLPWPFDLCAHLDEHFGQIGDFGLLRCVFQHGFTLGQVAAIRKFSVPVTVTMSVVMRAPLQPAAALGQLGVM
jgi:hypothetical protein